MLSVPLVLLGYWVFMWFPLVFLGCPVVLLGVPLVVLRVPLVLLCVPLVSFVFLGVPKISFLRSHLCSRKQERDPGEALPSPEERKRRWTSMRTGTRSS